MNSHYCVVAKLRARSHSLASRSPVATPKHWLLSASLLAVGLLHSAAQSQTVYEAFNLNPEGTSRVGIRYFNSSFGVQQNPWASIALDGESLLLRDPVWIGLPPENPPIPIPASGTFAFKPEARFAFSGTGLDIVHIRDNAGEPFVWQIVDGGSGNNYNVVAQGTVDTYTSSNTPFLETVPVAPQGSLDPNKVYMLRTWITDTDNSLVKRRVFYDSFNVYNDSAKFSIDDNSNLSGNWTFSENWDPAAPDDNSYEGDFAATPGPGETIDFNFNGTGLVVYGRGQSGVSGAYNWEIDGGAGGSGMVDQSLDSDYSVRWPELLVNGLSPGPHTLKITVIGTNAAGDYNNNGFVDAADYTVWRDNLGSSIALTNENPAATTPGVVDQEDYDFWVSRFGSQTSSGAFGPNLGFVEIDAIGVFNPAVAGSVAETAAVPEPGAIAILASGLLLCWGSSMISSRI